MSHHEVVVIGAGPSGLVAATDLHRAGVDVVVLEARDRVGGRTCTVDLDGMTVDVGGQWVGPTQHHLRRLLRELGLTTSPTPVAGRNVLVTGDGRQTYKGTIPRLPLLQLVELQRLLWSVDRQAARTHPTIVAAPHELAAADQSIADVVRDRGVRPEVVALLRTSLRVVFGAELEEVSWAAALQYTRQAGGFLPLVDTAGGAQDARVVGGMQQVSDRLAADLADRVHLATPVTTLRSRTRTDARMRERVEVGYGGGTVTAGQVVVAVPPNVSATWEWDGLLQPDRRAWLDAHRMGRTRKVQARYARPFWRDDGLSGEAVWTDGPFSVVFDDSRPFGGYGLVGFVVGAPADRVATMTDDARRTHLLDHLEVAFGPAVRDPIAWREEDWGDDPFSGGCPVAMPVPGGHTTGYDPTRADGPVLWAGTETARQWRGYIDGAVEAGHRAARQAITRAAS